MSPLIAVIKPHRLKVVCPNFGDIHFCQLQVKFLKELHEMLFLVITFMQKLEHLHLLVLRLQLL